MIKLSEYQAKTLTDGLMGYLSVVNEPGFADPYEPSARIEWARRLAASIAWDGLTEANLRGLANVTLFPYTVETNARGGYHKTWVKARNSAVMAIGRHFGFAMLEWDTLLQPLNELSYAPPEPPAPDPADDKAEASDTAGPAMSLASDKPDAMADAPVNSEAGTGGRDRGPSAIGENPGTARHTTAGGRNDSVGTNDSSTKREATMEDTNREIETIRRTMDAIHDAMDEIAKTCDSDESYAERTKEFRRTLASYTDRLDELGAD